MAATHLPEETAAPPLLRSRPLDCGCPHWPGQSARDNARAPPANRRAALWRLGAAGGSRAGAWGVALVLRATRGRRAGRRPAPPPQGSRVVGLGVTGWAVLPPAAASARKRRSTSRPGGTGRRAFWAVWSRRGSRPAVNPASRAARCLQVWPAAAWRARRSPCRRGPAVGGSREGPAAQDLGTPPGSPGILLSPTCSPGLEQGVGARQVLSPRFSLDLAVCTLLWGDSQQQDPEAVQGLQYEPQKQNLLTTDPFHR